MFFSHWILIDQKLMIEIAMKTLTAKQEARQEKKKKKMAALAEIIKLNDKDRRNKGNRSSLTPTPSPPRIEMTDAIKKCEITLNTGQNVIDTTGDPHTDYLLAEPSYKRMRIDKCSQTDRLNVSYANNESRIKIETFVLKNQEVSIEYYNKFEQENIMTTEILKNAVGSDVNLRYEKNERTVTEITGNVISDDKYVEIKKEINERRRHLKHIPKLRLKLLGESSSLAIDAQDRTPIFLTDIQHLLMVALLGSSSPCTPWRWCHLEKGSKLTHCIVLVVEGLSLFHFSSYESIFKESKRIFDNKLEVLMPPYRDGGIIEEFATVPLTNTQKEELILKYGSLEAAMEATQDPTLMMKTVFPVETVIEHQPNDPLPQTDSFSRTQLLLSALQMVDEGYPLPLRGELSVRYKDFILTKDSYAAVSSHSPMFAVDCEMCRTSAGVNELTRISIINENLVCVYETLVRPENKIVDYLTKYSGITEEMMKNVTKTLSEVQVDIRNLLPADAILIGQSLNVDLLALRMMHPYVIDTSVIFNLTGARGRKSKLQTLARQFLGETIQISPLGHDSVEDSAASMKLTKLKLAKGLDYGDAVLVNRKEVSDRDMKARSQSNQESSTDKSGSKEVYNNFFNHICKRDRSTAIIASNDVNLDYQRFSHTKIESGHQKGNGDSSMTEVIASDSTTTISNQLNNRITCYQLRSNESCIKRTKELALQNALTLTNVKIPPQRLELSRIEKTLSNVDRWIGNVWDSMAPHGMFVVLLGGVPGAQSGVAMIQIKKNTSLHTSTLSSTV